jgi:hypothetical protein
MEILIQTLAICAEFEVFGAVVDGETASGYGG